MDHVSTVSDAMGGTTAYTYDAAGNRSTITDAEGGVTSYAYDLLGRVTSMTDARGNTWTYAYDNEGRDTITTDPLDGQASKSYDAIGQLVGETDANGNTWTYAYDNDGRMTSKTDPLGAVTTFEYDAVGNLLSSTTPLAHTTAYTYDERDRQISETAPLEQVITFYYDDGGKLTGMTHKDGSTIAYSYDLNGNTLTVTDEEGYVVSYEYDGNQNMVTKTTVDGVTSYEYDALDRLISTTTPDGKTETFTYNGEGQIISSTDKGGHTTQYILNANGKIIKTIDALGNSALFGYDSMGNLVKTSLHRVDAKDSVDEWEITTYEYDGRNLVTREVDALGNVTTYTYDGNGNLKTKTDADGYVTEYSYNSLDLVKNINYNGGKQVSYVYNAVGDLVEMTDWMGTTSFELDLLSRITRTTDTKGKVVEYGYDAVGNQTSVAYPDGTAAVKTYDLTGNLKTVTETDGRITAYAYDGMGRITHMDYPDGWQEDYTYDAIGQLLKVEDTDPTQQDLKQQKHACAYDDCGNLTYEYIRGNGTGEATVENTYTYDALHRVVTAHEDYGNKDRAYTYDSLGNLTLETNSNNVTVDYILNNFNQITSSSDDGWDTDTAYTYDNRGNLLQEVYTKNSKQTVTGAYVYGETNKMVSATNDIGEQSLYIYDGLGALVENTWIIKKNAYGYQDITTQTVTEGEVVVDSETGDKQSKEKKSTEEVAADPELNVTTTVVKQYAVDYTSPTYEPLMEYEAGGLSYRYVYGNDRLSVDIDGVDTSSGNLVENGDHIRLYYHMDYQGTADYLTSPVSQKVESWTHYNEWGEITHNAVLKCGSRELDLVKRYATHDYDSVLGMYYAKARFYDPELRRFAAMDPIKGNIAEPITLVQYIYVINNPLTAVDPLGLFSSGDILRLGDRNYDVIRLKKALNRYQNMYSLAIAGNGKTDFNNAQDIKPTTRLNEASNLFDWDTYVAVNRFKDAIMPGGNIGSYRGKVGESTWRALGLSFIDENNRIVIPDYTPVPTSKVKVIENLPDFENMSFADVAEFLLDVYQSAPQVLFAWDPQQAIWYSTLTAPQRAFGYNDIYNDVFTGASILGVSYRSFISFFDASGYFWRVEGWKGNYLQMGVGAEIGIYAETIPEHEERTTPLFWSDPINEYMMKVVCDSSRHYPVSPSAKWPTISMTMKIYGRVIFNRPAQTHWWLNGFSPSTPMTNPNNIVVVATIDFNDAEVAKWFRRNIDYGAIGEGTYPRQVTRALNISWVKNVPPDTVSFTWS